MKISINNGVTEKIEELAESWYEKYETSKDVLCEYKKFHIKPLAKVERFVFFMNV